MTTEAAVYDALKYHVKVDQNGTRRYYNVRKGKVANDMMGNEIWARPEDKDAQPVFNEIFAKAWGDAKAAKR